MNDTSPDVSLTFVMTMWMRRSIALIPEDFRNFWTTGENGGIAPAFVDSAHLDGYGNFDRRNKSGRDLSEIPSRISASPLR